MILYDLILSLGRHFQKAAIYLKTGSCVSEPHQEPARCLTISTNRPHSKKALKARGLFLMLLEQFPIIQKNLGRLNEESCSN